MRETKSIVIDKIIYKENEMSKKALVNLLIDYLLDSNLISKGDDNGVKH